MSYWAGRPAGRARGFACDLLTVAAQSARQQVTGAGGRVGSQFGNLTRCPGTDPVGDPYRLCPR